MTKVELTLIHTNDLHGSIEHFGKLAAYLTKKRESVSHFLYLDAGDISSGHPVVDWDFGRPIVNLLNDLKLDAMAIGNHDFDYGQHYFRRNQQVSRFPWLSANIKVNDQGIPITELDPFIIFDYGDLKVGVVSVTEAPPATNPENLKGLEFLDPIQTMKHYTYLKQEVDVLIALTHVGITLDREITEEMDAYDLIIGGHSHSMVELETRNGTPIVNTGAHGLFLGNLTLIWDSEIKQLDTIKSEMVEVASLEKKDESIQAKVDAYFDARQETLGRVIGETKGLSLEKLFEQDTALGNFWTDALKFVSQAEIALSNNAGMRFPIEPGSLTVGHIYRAAPFHNNLIVFEMTGQAIYDVVRYSFAKRNKIDLQTSGLTYLIWKNEDNETFELELFINGEPLNLQKVYRVVTSDYIGLGGDGYVFQGKILEKTTVELSEALIIYAEYCMRTNKIIDYQSENRIKVQTRIHSTEQSTNLF